MECLRVNHTNPLHVKADFTISILIPLFHLRAPPPRSLHVFFYAGGSAAFGMRIRALDVADGSRQRPARRPSLLFSAFLSSNNGVKGEKVKVFTGHSVIFVLWAAPSPGLGFTTLGPRSRPPPLLPPLVFRLSVLHPPSSVGLFCHLTLRYAKNSASLLLLLLPRVGGMHACLRACVPSLPSLFLTW